MKRKLLFCALVFSLPGLAQTTSIPDPNFEQQLIFLGYDTGTPDGHVPTANISGITYLVVTNAEIASLEGIQDFVALQELRCNGNELTNVHLEQNTALMVLDISDNQLSALNLSQNTSLVQLNFSGNGLATIDLSHNHALEVLRCDNNILALLPLDENDALLELYCTGNHLSTLDVSQNFLLNTLVCDDNYLQALDLSPNTALHYISCRNNLLRCLNLKNGNNINMQLYAKGNPYLDCIEVQSLGFAIANWTVWVDPSAYFSNYCWNQCSTGLDEIASGYFSVYPNPVGTSLTIEGELPMDRISIMNAAGAIVWQQHASGPQEQVSMENLAQGIYLVEVEFASGRQVIRIVKE